MKQYRDSYGCIYQVMPDGIGGYAYKGQYLKPGSVSWHRIAQLPWRNTKAEAQADLEAYAEEKGWEVI